MTLVNFVMPGQLQWRSFEREGAEAAFGSVRDVHVHTDPEFTRADAVRWFPASENCTPEGYQWMQAMRAQSRAGHHINDALNYLRVHDKVECFDVWKYHGIPIPKYYTWEPGQFVRPFDPPFLLRLNNGVAGYDSWIVRCDSEIPAALEAVERCYHAVAASKRGAVTRLLCTEFIDTRGEHPLNVSYRITVAGRNVITGYARVSDPEDWVAVTNKFHSGIAEAWLHYNVRCHEIMDTYHSLLVRAVEVLGLNHQGLDVIQDGKTGQLYFLEVQTTYDAGFIGAGAYRPPYYNPYNPELVQFIQQNEAIIKELLPLYYYRWLDKREHFKACYESIKNTMT